MGIDRRDFFKVAGLAALGLVGKGAADVFASGQEETSQTQKNRYAMIVDTRKCKAKEGCTICKDTCHKVHNVPKMDDPKHEIHWMWQEPYQNLFPSQEHDFMKKEVVEGPIVALCNHCNNPPCTRVCPTQATFKRESDGIVIVDPHRCIGCRYCIAACPYGARSFNWKNPRPYIEHIEKSYPPRDKGVVEKCNFCTEWVSKGELPRCVNACPEKALTFGDLHKNEEMRKLLQENYTIRRKPGLGTNPQVYYIV